MLGYKVKLIKDGKGRKAGSYMIPMDKQSYINLYNAGLIEDEHNLIKDKKEKTEKKKEKINTEKKDGNIKKDNNLKDN